VEGEACCASGGCELVLDDEFARWDLLCWIAYGCAYQER
jgi:hypothetical protein